MTELRMMSPELSFNFPSNLCLTSQSWEILEAIKRDYDRKLERSYEENEQMRKELRRLETEKNKLEAEKEDLVNDVQDLRALLKRIHEEGESQLDRLMKNNRELKEQVSTYKSALETAHAFSSHFDQMSFFWQENLSI